MRAVSNETPLAHLDISVRLLNGLLRALPEGCDTTYGNALAVTDRQLLLQHGIGKGCVAGWTAFKKEPRLRLWVENLKPCAEVLTGEAEDTEEALLCWKVERLEAAVAQLTKEKQDAERSATEARRKAAAARDRLEVLVSSLTVRQLRHLGVEVSYDLIDLPTDDEED